MGQTGDDAIGAQVPRSSTNGTYVSNAMYLIEDMIDMGLREGQEWPSEAHRDVAANLAIGNPMVRSMDSLMAVVEAVCSIPTDKIKTVRMGDLPEYGLNLFVGT